MAMNIDYNAVTAWAAMLTALTAVIAIWLQERRARFSQGVDILLRLTQQFENGNLLEARRSLAKLVLADGLPTEIDDFNQPRDALISEILNHYQTVGMLLQKRVLDRELVYSDYFNKLNHYRTLLKSYMAAYRKKQGDTTIWEDVDWLCDRLSALERKYVPRGADISPSQESPVEFLHEESNLK
jgi:hypothetical protein